MARGPAGKEGLLSLASPAGDETGTLTTAQQNFGWRGWLSTGDPSPSTRLKRRMETDPEGVVREIKQVPPWTCLGFPGRDAAWAADFLLFGMLR